MENDKQKSDVFEFHIHKKQPEHTYEYNLSMYDELPYERDSDICNPKFLESQPSAVYHYYNMDSESYKINDSK